MPDVPTLLLATLLPSLAMAQVTKVPLAEMPLNETPIDGVSAAPISGDMDADGTFAANGLMEDGSLFPPHRHPDARISLVVEGRMYLGVGDTVDPAAEQVFEAGSVALTPAGVPHWMAARDGDVRIVEIGTGPAVTEWSE